MAGIFSSIGNLFSGGSSDPTHYTKGSSTYAPGMQPIGSTAGFLGDASFGGSSTPSFGQSAFGFTDKNGMKTNGWAGAALGLGQGLMQGFQGMQQYGMAKKAFKEGQRQYNQDYAAQKKLTNANLEDRQRARVASNSGAYQSVSEYMEKHGIK